MDMQQDSPLTYRIRIDGHLKDQWASWLDDMVVKIENHQGQPWHTTITVCVPDQAALRGILNKLWDLNLTLVQLSLDSYEASSL